MSLSQFWDDDPKIFWVYLEAYEQEQKARIEYDNNVAFLQGQYMMLAIAQCLQGGKHTKQIYPKQPFDVGGTQETPNYQKAKEADEIRKAQWLARYDDFRKNRRNTNG